MKRVLIWLLLSSCTRTVTTTIDGSGSSGNITGSQWREITGCGAKIESPGALKTKVKFNKKGSCEFELTVSDNAKNFSKDSIIVTVNK